MKRIVKKKPENINRGKALGQKTKKRFNSICDIKRFLSRVMNELDADIIPENKAKALGYLCNIMKDCIKEGDLEARILKLEQEALKNDNAR